MSMKGLPTGPQPVEVEGKKNPVLYGDGRTKQSFKDQADINKILMKAQRAGGLSHLAKHGAQYGDFTDVPDLLTAYSRLQRAEQIHAELPSELRREFPTWDKFFTYVNDPANADQLEERIPALAKPGRQRPAVIRSAASEADPKVVSAPAEPSTPSEPPSAAPAPSEGASGA